MNQPESIACIGCKVIHEPPVEWLRTDIYLRLGLCFLQRYYLFDMWNTGTLTGEKLLGALRCLDAGVTLETANKKAEELNRRILWFSYSENSNA